MSEFTKGKWEVEAVYGDHSIVTANGRIVADCFNSEDNARLIAAAPELYELVKDFCDEVEAFVSIYDNFPEEFIKIAVRAKETFERIDEEAKDE